MDNMNGAKRGAIVRIELPVNCKRRTRRQTRYITDRLAAAFNSNRAIKLSLNELHRRFPRAFIFSSLADRSLSMSSLRNALPSPHRSPHLQVFCARHHVGNGHFTLRPALIGSHSADNERTCSFKFDPHRARD